MPNLPYLKPGDAVQLVAPASRCRDQQLMAIKALLESWGLNCLIAADIFGDDLICANSDEMRLQSLQNALENPQTKAIICVRGGYGSMRLIPALSKLAPPKVSKLFIGMSDITALNLFLMQTWQWPVLHAAPALDKFSAESIADLKAVLFGERQPIQLKGRPLNSPAEQDCQIKSSITGGNLCLLQTSIGTQWQMQGRHKIIFLEETNERAYRIDRMLEHLRQATLFDDVSAILFGDFLGGEEPDGSSLVQPVIARFAKKCQVPVVQIAGLGHGPTNFPLPLGIAAKLQLGKEVTLII